MIWAAVIVVLLAVGAYFFWSMPPVDEGANTTSGDQVNTIGDGQEAPGPETVPSGTSTGSVDVGTGSGSTSYSATVVATHNSATSCWTIIDGNVYDLTKWIPQHPGGAAAIKQLCGKDGTALFHGQHDDAKRQADILATFKIGVLAQ